MVTVNASPYTFNFKEIDYPLLGTYPLQSGGTHKDFNFIIPAGTYIGVIEFIQATWTLVNNQSGSGITYYPDGTYPTVNVAAIGFGSSFDGSLHPPRNSIYGKYVGEPRVGDGTVINGFTSNSDVGYPSGPGFNPIGFGDVTLAAINSVAGTMTPFVRQLYLSWYANQTPPYTAARNETHLDYYYWVLYTAGSGLGVGKGGGPLAYVRDYTHRLIVANINAAGNLIADLYDDGDATPTSISVDMGTTNICPSFYRQDVYIEGTYLAGTTPMFARSRQHGRLWSVATIPGTYDACTSTQHKGRIVFLGFKAAGPQWYCRVGVPNDSGVYTWSSEVSLALSNPNGSGHLKTRNDGVLEFVWQDTTPTTNILRGRGIANNGTGTWT